MRAAKRVSSFSLVCLFLTCIPGLSQEKHMQLLAPGVGWALGADRLYWTTDNGAHWADVTPSKAFPNEKIADVYFKDVTDGWALLAANENNWPEPHFELASTVDSGAGWSVAPVGIPGLAPPNRAPLYGAGRIFFLDAAHGWLALDLEVGLSHASLLIATDDGGSTWVRRATVNAGAIRFLTLQDGWIAGGPNGEGLYATTDGGGTWREISLPGPPGAAPSACAVYGLPAFTDTKHGSVLGPCVAGEVEEAGLFASHDGGKSWRVVKAFPRPPVWDVNSAVGMAGTTWVMASQDWSTLTLWQTDASGPHSQVAKIIARSPGVRGISFMTLDEGWVLTDRLLATTDGGGTWKDISPWPALRFEPRVPAPSSNSTGGGAPVPPSASVEPLGGGGGAAYHTSIHMGFDRCNPTSWTQCQWISNMQTWWTYSPYYDLGLYIGGPNMSKCLMPGSSANLSKVTGQGWGVMPIWVGLQDPCYTDTSKTYSTFSTDPATAESQGATEATNAAKTAKSLGLAGSVIYVDLENYDPNGQSGACGTAAVDFAQRWVSKMHVDG